MPALCLLFSPLLSHTMQQQEKNRSKMYVLVPSQITGGIRRALYIAGSIHTQKVGGQCASWSFGHHSLPHSLRAAS